MSLTTKLFIALVIALITSTLTAYLGSGEPFDLLLLLAFAAATLLTVLATHRAAVSHGHSEDTEYDTGAATSGDRETGEVKWFNGTKGFGFIIRENGEEIFVHFRSIRGEGRRGLSDGQPVSFVVTQSDKGPQAEDVEPL